MADSFCKTCSGSGFIPVPDQPKGPPVTQVCLCVLREEIVMNLERGMRGLSEAMPLDRGEVSPLVRHTKNDVRLTAAPLWMASHLRYTAARMPTHWGFRVVTDADLMVAWLATAALQGTEIIDPDARSEAAPVSLTKLTLVDISEPPDLLIIRLGIKVARNSAMCEVLYEALTIRNHARKPTWLWDQPDFPFDQAHLAYSRQAEEFTAGWDRVHEADLPQRPPPKKGAAQSPRSGGTATPTAAGTGSGPSLRDLMFNNTGSKR